MTRELDREDIQGTVVRAYGRFSFPFARDFFRNIADPAEGRRFVSRVAPAVTTAARWPEEAQKPDCTVNIGFTFLGLNMLEVPSRTLKGMPDEFVEGMKARAFALRDRDTEVTEGDAADWEAHWDPIWRANRGPDRRRHVHIWMSLNAQADAAGRPVPTLEARTDWIRTLCEESDGGVRLLDGHGRDGALDHQPASAVFDDVGGVRIPTAREHLGFTDGIGDPVFEGQYRPAEMPVAVKGRGKRVVRGWAPLAVGEFILGHPDESQELPPAARPSEFSANGSFMVYRKLHESVGSFHAVLAEDGARYARVMGVPQAEAEETLRAKMCGRWSDGVPVAVVPTFAEWTAFRSSRGFDDPDARRAPAKRIEYIRSAESSDFRYAADMKGFRCPCGVHIRRMNTRDYLDPLYRTGTDPATGKPDENLDATGALNKRRHVLRRGLPYGPADGRAPTDDTEQGVTMMLIGGSPFRQFEFVQQQWVQYGLDFHQSNNTCPLLGAHERHKRFTIPSDPATGRPSHVMGKLRTFVECRAGDYFFVPPMTALRLIAMGVVDPT